MSLSDRRSLMRSPSTKIVMCLRRQPVSSRTYPRSRGIEAKTTSRTSRTVLPAASVGGQATCRCRFFVNTTRATRPLYELAGRDAARRVGGIESQRLAIMIVIIAGAKATPPLTLPDLSAKSQRSAVDGSGEFDSRCCGSLRVNAREIHLNGLHAVVERASDLLFGHSLCHEARDFLFGVGKERRDRERRFFSSITPCVVSCLRSRPQSCHLRRFGRRPCGPAGIPREQ